MNSTDKLRGAVKYLRQKRRVQGLSQRAVSKRLGRSINTVGWWENGTETPSLLAFMEWCKALGVCPARALNSKVSVEDDATDGRR